MIDLNEVWQPPSRYDLDEIRNRLCAMAAEWLPRKFPHARLSPDRKTLRCADLTGRAPRNEGSCVIHLRGPRAGWGYDHATGESAGPIDLLHFSTGLTPPALFDEAAREARLDQPAPMRTATPARADHSHEVARILAGCTALAGSVAARYLHGRGLKDTQCPDLLFSDDLTDFETKRGWPGMVAHQNGTKRMSSRHWRMTKRSLVPWRSTSFDRRLSLGEHYRGATAVPFLAHGTTSMTYAVRYGFNIEKSM